MKAELGRRTAWANQVNFYKSFPGAVSIARPLTLSPARYRWTTAESPSARHFFATWLFDHLILS